MGDYIDAGGVRMYYEVAGEGEPVLLLHGGGGNAEHWTAQVTRLSEHYRVYAPERRGHGRSPDADGPVTMELMAADTAAFMAALGLESAAVIGWSDGGKVAAWLTHSRPELVSKLVLIGAELTRAGATIAGRALESGEGLEQLRAYARPEYERLSPDGPEHFDVVFAKWAEMWQTMPDFDLADLKSFTMPVLLMQGDDDCVRVDHSVEAARALPDVQLAIVPGTSHGLPLEKPGLVTQILLDFLNPEQAPKYLPMGALER
jgi:pimeloyl-ACP methyl ester carboxylesterase